MSHGLREKIIRRLRLKDTWVICFMLGLIMMNYPFLSIFNKPAFPFGIPMLYLYLLLGWLISIFVVYLFSRAADKESDNGES
jgi:hypothetical protein